MKPVRRLQLRRDALVTLDTDEARQVGGHGTLRDLTPVCPVVVTLPLDRCLSVVICTLTEGVTR